MRFSVHDIAVEVIRAAGREKPADQALREVLKKQRELPPFDAAAVSQAVFAYYRWHAWLRDERTVDARMRLSRRMAERFRANPKSIPLAELREKAVPAWTHDVMPVSDDWLRSLQQEPMLWLRARREFSGALEEKLPGAVASDIFPNAFTFAGETNLFQTPEFHTGEFEIQDIASQAVGWLCAPKPGETWWDTCAGEGGKLLHLSDLMQNKGLIWASDRAEWRLKTLKRRTARAKAFHYRAAVWDGGAKLPTKTKFDGVLVDAPCSGLGTWQRNPHARWTASADDVRELAEIQKRLLTNVAPSVKPGGKLIFAVCTLTHAETSEVVEFFNQTQSEFEPVPLGFPAGTAQEKFAAASTVTIWPQDLGGNGMFVAGWKRR